MSITFFVPGEPVPKARPRVIQRHTIHGAGEYVTTHAYTPRRTIAHEQAIGWRALAAHPGLNPDAQHEWAVFLQFFCQRRPGRLWPAADTDNLVKAVLDGLNGVAWKDDSQVSYIRARRSTVPKLLAGTRIRLLALTPLSLPHKGRKAVFV